MMDNNVKRTAKFVKEISVIDPDSKGQVEISIFKHSNGGMFGLDSSFIDQAMDDDFIVDPFIQRKDKYFKLKLTGY
jgi:hypothetical protein